MRVDFTPYGTTFVDQRCQEEPYHTFDRGFDTSVCFEEAETILLLCISFTLMINPPAQRSEV